MLAARTNSMIAVANETIGVKHTKSENKEKFLMFSALSVFPSSQAHSGNPHEEE